MSNKGSLTTAKDGIFLDLRDGKANAEAERFPAKQLGVSRPDVAVIRGASSRDEVVLVRSVQAGTSREVLTPHPR